MSKMRTKLKGSLQHTPRFQALLILVKIDQNQSYSNLMVKQVQGLSDCDRRLVSELVYGTIANKIYLDYLLAHFIAGKKVDPWVKQLLLMALFQFEFLNRIPEHAIINESVKIAKAAGNEGVAKFVNAILRKVQRTDMTPLRQLSDIADREEQISIRYSLPQWLVHFLSQQYGVETVERLGDSLTHPSRVSARITGDIERDTAIRQLTAEGITVEKSQVSPFGIVGEKGFLAGSSLFKNGQLTIQDESSMLVAEALDVPKMAHVLDACAAPGGKTVHIASYLDQGQIEALDIHPHKLKLIAENAERLHEQEKVQTHLLDARQVGEQFANESFDRILVDAPCSGLGLMRRKPDIKYTKKESDLENLPAIQLAILNACAPTLKKGGKLVYSTCTINKKENEEVVQQFLAEHPDFSVCELPFENRLEKSVHQHQLTLLPQDYGTDGFFICCMKRNEVE